MIKLLLVFKAAALFVYFDIPSSGNYYLFASDGKGHLKIEASNHVRSACHVTCPIPTQDQAKLMWVQFTPDNP